MAMLPRVKFTVAFLLSKVQPSASKATELQAANYFPRLSYNSLPLIVRFICKAKMWPITFYHRRYIEIAQILYPHF